MQVRTRRGSSEDSLEAQKVRFQVKGAFFGESFGSIPGWNVGWVGCFHGEEGGALISALDREGC